MPAAKPARHRNLLRGGVVALAIVVALIAWLATRDGGGDSPSPSAEVTTPRIVSVDELREVAAEIGQPIYWAGSIAGKELELRGLGAGGGVQVLYQPEGAEAGSGSAGSPTIGSYPLADPEHALAGYAGRRGSEVRQTRDGSEVVSSRGSPNSVYLSSPDNSVQVEVYDPSPRRAMSIAVSGRVEPVG